MNTPIYIPIFRLREQEKAVLTSFEFDKDIFPYVEIFKEKPRKSPVPSSKPSKKIKKEKKFHEHYLPTLNAINSEYVFVDLPVHLHRTRKMNEEVIEFLLKVVEKRDVRTAYMLSLSSCKKVIPVVSTYSQISGEKNSILLQEAELRQTYSTVGYRTSEMTLDQDMLQIERIARPQDFLFVDLEEFCLSNNDDFDAVTHMLERLKGFRKCNVILINSPIAHTITNVGLHHGQQIVGVDNSLMDRITDLGVDGFSDYAGVKKDLVESGGGMSPGLIFYDAIENSFYGFRGKDRKKNEQADLDDLRGVIIRDLLTSSMVSRMKGSHLEYLGTENKGWKTINNMWDKVEKWKSQAKFKRIAMEHYLHCIQTKIQDGYFVI